MKIDARHGLVYEAQKVKHGYFGWPTVTRMDDGTLVVGASGFRAGHVCPWGKTVLFFSEDSGSTWSEPRILNDTPLDDRDCGVLSLGGDDLLVSWFSRRHCMIPERYSDVTDDISKAREFWKGIYGEEALRAADAICADEETFDAAVKRWSGSWCRISRDGGGNFGDFVRAPVNAPHGPSNLNDDEIIYLGKEWDVDKCDSQRSGGIKAYKSSKKKLKWEFMADIPLPNDTLPQHFYEPHVIKTRSGRVVGIIRYQYFRLGFIKSVTPYKHEFTERERSLFVNEAYHDPSLFITISEDDGRTWSEARPIPNSKGVPGFLMTHSSGALICTYSYRVKPYGIRALVSWDEGDSWEEELVIRDDGVTMDLGYPSTAELDDGSILTVYYQQTTKGAHCVLNHSIWNLPRNERR